MRHFEDKKAEVLTGGQIFLKEMMKNGSKGFMEN